MRIKFYSYNLSSNAKKNATSAFNEHFPWIETIIHQQRELVKDEAEGLIGL